MNIFEKIIEEGKRANESNLGCSYCWTGLDCPIHHTGKYAIVEKVKTIKRKMLKKRRK